MIQMKYANLYIEKYDGKNLLVDFVQESEFIYFRNNGDYLPSMRLGEYEPTQILFRGIVDLPLKDGDVILFPIEALRKIRREKIQNRNEIQRYSTIAFEIENGEEYFETFNASERVKYSKKKALQYHIKTTWEEGWPCSLEHPSGINELWVLDVGQGSTNFIFGEGNYLTVFDFGTYTYASKSQIKDIINNYNRWLISCHTSLIISHWDCDHYNILTAGDESLLRNLCCVFVPEKAISLTAKQVIKKLEKNCRYIVAFSSPQTQKGSRVGMQVIRENANYQLFIGERSADTNKSGLALAVYGRNGIAMLSADHRNSQVWKDMYGKMKSCKGTQELHIVLPHHGANCGRLYKKLSIHKAGISAVSVGKNSYNHPNQKTLDYYEGKGFEVKRTDCERKDIIIKL